MIHSFKPLVKEGCTVLILGSMPSITSLEKNEYYGFKHNRFWKIMSQYYNVSLDGYEAKKQLLFTHQIALWDVIASCEREGSLDTKIKKETPNDLESFLLAYPTITCIFCNGKKSFDLYQKHFSHLSLPCFYLPSTSNANRSIDEKELFAIWFAHLQKYKT